MERFKGIFASFLLNIFLYLEFEILTFIMEAQNFHLIGILFNKNILKLFLHIFQVKAFILQNWHILLCIAYTIQNTDTLPYNQ